MPLTFVAVEILAYVNSEQCILKISCNKCDFKVWPFFNVSFSLTSKMPPEYDPECLLREKKA